EIGIDFIGGYSALIQKGAAPFEIDFLNTIPQALSLTKKVCSSVNLASTKSGINMDGVRLMGEKIKETAFLTKDNDSIGCAKLIVFANAVDDNPFMAGAFNGIGEGDCIINVGVSGPGVVETALKKLPDADITTIAETIKKTAFKITRLGQLVATLASKRLNCGFGIIDLSLAPTPNIGDSVARIIEEMGISHIGSHGTTACLAILNDAVKKGGVMASSHVGGLSGAFIPVSEDIGMIERASTGHLTIDKLEAMTSVCSVGLDMIAIPGDTSTAIISAIIADECAIGVINNKTTAVRIIPVIGKKVGDKADFGGLLGSAPIMKIHQGDPSKFISRGGRVPAPIHSNKN
ncbi:MAG: PFL family protein, partial [Elusimicrobiota bacterium]|nr:PFL family protein [Elusimicrobiota bacterium]